MYTFWGRMVLVIFFCCSAACLALDENAIITKIEATRNRGLDYIDIYSSGDISAKGLLLEDRLVINCPKATLDPHLEIISFPSKRIATIEAQSTKAGFVKIIVKLKDVVDYEIVNVFGRGKSVVEISNRLDYTARLMAEWEKANLKTKPLALKPVKLPAPASTKPLPLTGKTIIVDAGHGGRDPGAISRSGYLEKNLTLATAKILAQSLNSAGATVYLTRGSDRSTGLVDIVAFAGEADAQLFISLHYNYAFKQEISGSETYYYTPQSRQVALCVHQAFLSGIKRKDRGLRRERFYTILNIQNMPAILVEPLFLSNSEEEELVIKPHFQEAVAADILRGVELYFRH